MTRRRGLVVIALTVLVTWDASVGSAGPDGDQQSPNPSAVDRVGALVKERRVAEAESLARRLLLEAEELSGTESLQTAEALDAIVVSLIAGGKGSLPESKSLAERAVQLKEANLGTKHLGFAFSLNALAKLLTQRDELAEAVESSRRVVEIREGLLGANNLEVGRGVVNVAVVEYRLGDYAAARRDYERALGIFQTIGAPEHPNLSILLNNFSLLLKDLGDYDGARTNLERVVAIQERALGPEHNQLGGSLENLCEVLRRMGDYAGAQQACRRSLAIWQKDPGPDTPEVATVMNTFGLLLTTAGEPSTARPMIEQAISIRSKWGQAGSRDNADNLSLLGEILRQSGDLQGARTSLVQALQVLERTLPTGHPSFVDVWRSLGEVDWKLGNARAAWEEALHATATARENLREMASGLSEREAIRYESTRQSSIGLLLSVLLFSTRESMPERSSSIALDEQIRSRAIVLDEIAGRHRELFLARSGERVNLIVALTQARNRLSRVLVSGPGDKTPDRYREEVRNAQEGTDRAERELAASSAEFRRRLAREQIGLGEVAAALPPASALVSYVSFNRVLNDDAKSKPLPSYLAFVLNAGDTTPAVVPLGLSAEIDAKVGRWRDLAGSNPNAVEVTASEESYRAAGSALRERIWDPVAAKLKSPEIVFLVPDGLLNLVNLAALPGPDGRYLIEEAPLLHHLSAERDLVRDRAAHRPIKSLLALGGVDYDARPVDTASKLPIGKGLRASGPSYRSPAATCGDVRQLRFEPLSASLQEVREVEALWTGKGRLLVLTGAQASESAIKNEAPGFDALHIATHGFFMQESCRKAPADTGSFDNPLLLSALALAGANARHALPANAEVEDGILTAEEISSLDLSGVDWVVLSACETGLGKVVSGEGVLGLRRAFEVAGAGTLIMSLWNVEDDATRVWMRGLYGARLSGMRTAEAVRKAATTIIDEQRRRGRTTHPFYWGGFVAAGDWR